MRFLRERERERERKREREREREKRKRERERERKNERSRNTEEEHCFSCFRSQEILFLTPFLCLSEIRLVSSLLNKASPM